MFLHLSGVRAALWLWCSLIAAASLVEQELWVRRLQQLQHAGSGFRAVLPMSISIRLCSLTVLLMFVSLQVCRSLPHP